MKLRAFDGIDMYYQKDQTWEVGFIHSKKEFACCFKRNSGDYLTTTNVMKYVCNYINTQDDKFEYIDLYENDIVRVKFHQNLKTTNPLIEKIGIIEYSEDHASFIIKWDYNKHQNFILFFDFKEIELLGNEFENPDLIKTISKGNICE